MILPTEPLEPTLINPELLAIYGMALCGKTTFLLELEKLRPKKYLILDCDGTAAFYRGCKVRCNSHDDVIDVMSEIKKMGKPYDFIALDSGSTFVDYCVPVATKIYNNTAKPEDKVDDIRKVGYGIGHEKLKDLFMARIASLMEAAPYVIVILHARDKWDKEVTKMMVGTKSEERSIEIEEATKVVDLPNKLASAFLKKAHAVGLMKKKLPKAEKSMISFEGTEDRFGARCQHLNGKTIEADWSKIYV